MRIFSRSMPRAFWERHADAEQPLLAWYAEAKKAEWKKLADILSEYRDVRIIGNNRAVFNIKGNDYRPVCAIRYDKGLVFVRFVGTHAQYDKMDALTV
jgi:mRNA interferase HigB